MLFDAISQHNSSVELAEHQLFLSSPSSFTFLFTQNHFPKPPSTKNKLDITIKSTNIAVMADKHTRSQSCLLG